MRRFARTFLFLPLLLQAGTTVAFDPSTPSTGPFPTDFLTVPDAAQRTGLRVNLPLPCGVPCTASQETAFLNQMDGFSVRPRIRLQFSAPVNTGTLRSGIFFVALENLAQDEPGINRFGDAVGIDEVIWDPAGNAAYARPAAVLDQHRRYALVVTDAVMDAGGIAVAADPAFHTCIAGEARRIVPPLQALRSSPHHESYCGELARALTSITVPLPGHTIVAASVFTTMNATAWLENARAVLSAVPPAATLAKPQSAFRVADIAGITLHEQTGANPVAFNDITLPISASLLAGLDRVVIGSYQSPNFLQADQTIAPAPTNASLAVPASTNQVGFNVLVPSTIKPAAGYPVVIFGHGLGDSRFGGPTAVAPTLARAGMATIAINAVGHGFGPQSSVSFTDPSGNTVTVNAMGRSIDLNGDGIIESEEGCEVLTPVSFGTRDCFRQTAVDLMQLVRVIRQGLDLDGDGVPDLDGGHIYYAGDSLGSLYGPIFMAMEPAVRAAVLNVGGGSTADIALWSPAYQAQDLITLGQRNPSLLNQGKGYNADYVLPQQPVHAVTTAGALPIQDLFATLDWLAVSGDEMSFVPHLRVSPLAGGAQRPVLVQFARADRTMPNPATSNLILAGGLQDSTWIYRHDLARAKAPDLPIDPHPFLVLFVSLGGSTIQLPGLDGLSISLDAQGQLAAFLGSDGTTIPDPNGLSKLLFGFSVFEIPKSLPFDLGF
jgi:hypothetical protein